MDRRELLKMIAVITGGAIIGGDFLLEGCKNPSVKTGLSFSADDIAFLDEVADTILPATKTPGAKAAMVGQFMTVIVNDCYEEADQKTFHEGISKLDEACKKAYNTNFMKASQQDRHGLLVTIDKEAADYQKKKNDFDKEQNEKAKGNNNYTKEKMPSHYFTLMKQLTLWGYFTSEVGIKQALKFVPVPGHYDACIDYKKGDKIMVGLT